MNEITLVLQQIQAGDASAADRLLPLMYDELRRLAAAKMSHEHATMTLQPTALVHEAWLRIGGENQPNWQNRGHFFASAAEAMRRILIDRARRRHAIRHGGGLARVDIDGPGVEIANPCESDDQLLAVNDALDRLAENHPRKAQLVKLRYFAGMTIEEAADALDISAPTAKRDWAFARAWLFREIKL